MGTCRKYLAAAASVLDNAADDLVLLYPLEPPNVPVNVIYIKLDSSHPSRPSTVDASGQSFIRLKVPNGRNNCGFADLPTITRWRRVPILALAEGQKLLQAAKQFAALIFDSAAETDQSGVIQAGLWVQFRKTGLAMSPFPRDLGGSGEASEVGITAASNAVGALADCWGRLRWSAIGVHLDRP